MTRTLRQVLAAAILSGGLALVIWAADTLRLDVNGQNLVWVVLVSVGVTWHASSRERLGWMAGMSGGATLGMLGFFATALWLPFSSSGRAIGLGVTALVVLVAAGLLAPRVPLLPAAAPITGFGLGIAAGLGADIASSTGLADVTALLTAAILAMGLGALTTQLMDRFDVRPKGQAA